MKKIILFLIACIGLLAAAAWIATPKAIEYLESKIIDALKDSEATLEYASIKPGFSGGWTATIQGPTFTQRQPGRNVELSSEFIRIKIPIQPFFKKRLAISDIYIKDPLIQIKNNPRLDDSPVRAESLPPKKSVKIPISIHQVRVENAETTFYLSSGIVLKADQINVVIRDPLIENQMYIEGKMRIFGSKQNTSFNIRLSRDKSNRLKVENSSLNVDMSDINEAKAFAIFNQHSASAIKGIEGVAEWDIEQIVFDRAIWESARYGLNLSDASITLNAHPETITKADIGLKQAGQNIQFEIKNAQWSGGEFSVDFLSEEPAASNMSRPTQLAFQVNGIHIEKISPPKNIRAPYASGLLYAGFRGSGHMVVLEELPYILSGEGQVALDRAALRNLNILRTIIDRLSAVPSVGGAIVSRIPVRYQAALNRPDTFFSRVEFPIRYQSGKLFLNQVPFVSEGFAAMVSGWADIAGNYFFRTYISLDDELTWNMMQVAPVLQYIINENKKLGLGVDFFSSPQGMQLKIDLQPLLSRAVQQVGGELLSQALGRF